MTKIEEQAFKDYPVYIDRKTLEDENELVRICFIDGAKFVVEQLTDKVRYLYNQHEPDNQEQEKITIKCNLLMEIVKELENEHT